MKIMGVLQAPSEFSAAFSAHVFERGHLAPSPTPLSAVEIPVVGGSSC